MLWVIPWENLREISGSSSKPVSHDPRTPHYKALIKVLRYLKLCPGQGNSLISWQSKKQTVVSRSSTEAEYRALADSTCEISWLKCLLHDLHVTIPTPTLMMCDNASTIALANNPIHNARTKHIEIDYILTKGLCRFLHYNCLSKLDIRIPCQLVGGGGSQYQQTPTESQDSYYAEELS
ncbi:homogeneously-staining region [Tanacetum coccineum]